MSRFRRLLERLEDRRTPTTFTVTDLSDSGPGTLRQAIVDANAATGPDVIDFSTGLTGTIVLASTLGTIEEALSVVGPGADKITVDANAKGRHLTLDDAADAAMAVSISGLTLANGRSSSGGSIRNEDANFTLTASVLRDNFSTGGGGGAISLGDGSKLTAVGCTLSGNTAKAGNGGAINLGYPTTVLIQNSVLSGNRATASGSYGSGGAIAASYGTLTVENSVISGNTAETVLSAYGGGGVQVSSYASATLRGSTITGNTAFGHGGGVNVIYAQALTIENCTVSGNTSQRDGGGVRVVSPQVASVIRNSTVAFNAAAGKGGGIFFYGSYYATLSLESVISATNTAKTGPDVSGTLAGDFTLLSNSADAFLTGSGNLLDFEPRLGMLTNNGGPTPTHLPASPSPVRDAGSNTAGLTSDQRGAGFPRLVGAAVDIGSVESAAGAPVAFPGTFAAVKSTGGTSFALSVTFADDTGIDTSKLGTGDIRVTGPGGFDVLATFTGSVPGGLPGETVASYTFTPPSGSWDAGDNGAYAISLEANQVFDTGGTAAAAGTVGTLLVAIPQPIVVNATNDESVDTDGLTSLREAVLASNASPAVETILFDPAVFAGPVTVTLNGELAVTDAVTITGPGSATLTVDAAQKSRHFKFDLVVAGGDVTVSGVTLTGGKNSGGFGGGSVFNEDANLTLSKVVLTGNFSGGIGGAIRMGGFTASKLLFVDSVASGNSCEDDGGAIGMPPGGNSVIVRRSLLANNQGIANDSDGGAIAMSGSFNSSLTIEDSTFTNNSAAGVDANGGGGAVYANGGTLTITGSTFSGNAATANSGGAIRLHASANMSIVNSTVSGNSAALEGGGVSQTAAGSGAIGLVNSSVAFNTAGGLGGGVAGPFAFPETIALDSTIVANNTGPGAPDVSGSVAANASFVGDTTGATIGGTVLTGDPLLGPLAANGGTTQTHALLAGSPAINAGSNILALATDQRGTGFVRVAGPAADIGAFEVQSGIVPPTVTKVQVNDGSVQRSRVTGLTVAFSEAVTFPAGINAAFVLNRTGPGSPTGAVNLSAVQSGNSVTLTFLDGGAVPTEGKGSLIDGVYQLTIVAANVQGAGGALDGDGNGTGGDNFQSPAAGAGRITRLFGDADGDGDVDAVDYGAFRAAFGNPGFTFDSDGDGDVDAVDFGQFRLRFGTSL